MNALRSLGRGFFRLLQICAFIAAIVTAVATAGAFLKQYRPNAAPATPPGIYIGTELSTRS